VSRPHRIVSVRLSEIARLELEYFRKHQPRIAAKISHLITATAIDPEHGIGKPERLRHEYAGCWSRRIDATNRLVYEISGSELLIIRLRFHYLEN